MSVRRNALIYLISYVFISLVCNISVLCLQGSTLEQLKMMGCLYFFELLFFLLLNGKAHGRFLNFSNVFVLILFMFHFGQLMIHSFFTGIYSHVRFLLLLNVDEAFYGFLHMHRAFSAICIGALMSALKDGRKIVSLKSVCINQTYNFESVAKKIVLLTFPVKLVLDIVTLFISLVNGGTAARQWVNSFPNVFLYWGKISLVGFALLLLIYRNKPVLQKKIFIFIEAYILLMMVSGIRSENVGYLCVFAFLYFASKIKKTRLVNLVLYSALGLLVLTFIVVVGQFRGFSDKSISAFVELFVEYLTKKNVLLSLMDTCGDTGYTALCVINKWLPAYGPTYGDSYYLGWFAIIPNIPEIFTFPGTITAASSFPLRMQAAGTLSNSYLNIGGSLIGELFFNFGLYGTLIFATIFGFFVGRVSYKSNHYIDTNNFYGMMWTIPVMFAVTYWVRDYFGGGIREMVWGPLVGILVISILKNRKSTQSI